MKTFAMGYRKLVNICVLRRKTQRQRMGKVTSRGENVAISLCWLQEGRFTQSANVCSAFYLHESVPPAQNGGRLFPRGVEIRDSHGTRNLGGIRPFICRSSSNRIKQNASRVFHVVFLPLFSPSAWFFFLSCIPRRGQVYVYAFYCTMP